MRADYWHDFRGRITAGMLLSLMLTWSACGGQDVRPEESTSEKPQRLVFRLKSKPKISEAHGGGDLGLPVWGHAGYSYHGELISNDRTFTLDLELANYAPIALFHYMDNYYLLCEGYMPGTRADYVWLKADAQLRFAPRKPANSPYDSFTVPDEFCQIQLENADWTAAYQVWVVSDFLEDNPSKQFDWFHKFVVANPRFCLDATLPGNERRRWTSTLEIKLERYASKWGRNEQLYNDLLIILQKSRATDDHDIMVHLYYYLWRVDAERGKKDIPDFVAEVREQHIANDVRLDAYTTIARDGYDEIRRGGNDTFRQ